MENHTYRDDFPALNRLIDGRQITYLDNAATTLKPRAVIDTIVRYYEENGCNIHRGQHYLSVEASTAYEEVRFKIAQFIGVFSNEVVFVKNTTEALNMVASGLALDTNDLVIGCLDSHHSQILPWQRHANLKLVRVDRDGSIDMDHYHDLLSLNPKVVALTHCSNVTGAIAPIEQMAKAAKEACEAVVVVDAAQSVPHQRINFSKLDIDFAAFSGHKMLAPSGVGCLYGKRDALECLQPLIVGGGMVDWVDVKGSRERKIPHRFEAGTPSIASVLGLGAAVSYLDSVGAECQLAHEDMLIHALLTGALSRDYIEIIGPREPSKRSSILTFRIRGHDQMGDIAQSLGDSYGVMCRSGHMCAQPIVDLYAQGEVLRASTYIYNTVSEIEALFSALDELHEWFS